MSFFRIILAVLVSSFIVSTSAKGATFITATITITNTPGVGSNWTVNGVSQTWTNAAGTPPASWLTVGADFKASTTNLYNHIIRYPYLSPDLIPTLSSPSNIVLRGNSIVITTNNYFRVSYSTNSGTNLTFVQVPFDNVVGDTNRTNNANWLIDGLNKYASTNAFNTNATALSNYLQTGAGPRQYIASPKQFAQLYVVTGGLTNCYLINVINLSGFVSALTNGYWTNAILDSVSLTNPVLNGEMLTASIRIGSNNVVTGDFNSIIGFGNSVDGDDSIVHGELNTIVTSSGVSLVVGNNNILTNAYLSPVIGDNNLVADAAYGGVFGNGNILTNNYTYIFGTGGRSTGPGQTIFAGTTNTFVIEGILRAASVSNFVTLAGSTNVFRGDVNYPWFALSTLANGNNISVPLGTNRYVRLVGTLTASANLCGAIAGATTGGRDGQPVTLWNDSGQNIIVTQDTSDPIPANRFSLYGGNAVTMLPDTFLDIVYAPSIGRWKVSGQFPPGTNLTAIATNAIASASGKGTNTQIYTSLQVVGNEDVTGSLTATNPFFYGVVYLSGGQTLESVAGELLIGEFYSKIQFIPGDVEVGYFGSDGFHTYQQAGWFDAGLNTDSATVTNNISYRLNTIRAATNSTVNTNITLAVTTGRQRIVLTNSASFTNITGMAAGASGDFVMYVEPQLVNRTAVWPAAGNSFGYHRLTNENSTLWTTLTAGVVYAVSGSYYDTNILLSITKWQ